MADNISIDIRAILKAVIDEASVTQSLSGLGDILAREAGSTASKIDSSIPESDFDAEIARIQHQVEAVRRQITSAAVQPFGPGIPSGGTFYGPKGVNQLLAPIASTAPSAGDVGNQVGQALQSARLQSLQALDEDTAALVLKAKEERAVAAQLASILAVDAEYIKDTKTLTVARQRQAASVAEALAIDEAYKDAQKVETVAKQRLAADLQRQLSLDEEYIQAKATETAARKLIAAKAQQTLLAEESYLSALAIDTRNKLTKAALESRVAAGGFVIPGAPTPTGTQAQLETQINKGVIAARERLEKEVRLTSELETRLGVESTLTFVKQKELREAIESGNLEDAINSQKLRNLQLEKIRERRALAAGLPPTGGGGGGGGIGGGSGRLGFFAGGFRSVLRFGVASTVLYGVASGAREAFREAVELEKVLNQIRRQLESQFGPAAEAQFKIVEQGIFDIAETTGYAADEIGKVAFQFQGAFGGNTVKAVNETRNAIVGAVVTGLELGEVIDSFTAISQSFKDANTGTSLSIQAVTDQTLALQEEFGVLAKETIKFTADLAPVGAQLGFTANELETLGAAAQKFSGRSGSALAEAFGRVLPQVQENAVDIINLFSALRDGVRAELVEAFGDSDIQRAFEVILSNFNNLSEAQQLNLGDLLGGRREFQSIIGVLRNGEQVVRAFDDSLDSSGKTAEYFADQQNTVQLRIATLSEEFRHLVQQLYDSGLSDLFLDLIDLGSLLIDVFGGVASILGVVADIASTPVIGQLLQAGAIAGLGKFAVGSIAGIGGGAVGATVASGLTAAGLGPLTLAITGSLTPAVLGLTAVLAANEISQNNRRAATVAGLALESGGISGGEIRRVTGLRAQEAEKIIADAYAEGLRGDDLTRALEGSTKTGLAPLERFYDKLPFDLSKRALVRGAELESIAKSLAQDIVDDYSRGFAAITSPSDRAEVLRIAEKAFSDADVERLARLARPSTDDASIGTVPVINPFARLFGIGGGGPDDPGTSEEVTAELEGLRQRFRQLLEENGGNVEKALSLLSDEVPDSLRGVFGNLSSSIASFGLKLDDARVASAAAITSTEEVEAKMELGIASNLDLIEALERELSTQEELFERGGADLTSVLKARATLQQAIVDSINQEVDALGAFEDLTGQDLSGLQIEQLTAALSNPDISAKAKGDIANQIIEIQREQLEDIGGFVEVSQQVRKALVGGILANNQAFITAVGQIQGVELEQAIAIATSVYNNGQVDLKAGLNALVKQIFAIHAARGRAASTIEAVSRATSAVFGALGAATTTIQAGAQGFLNTLDSAISTVNVLAGIGSIYSDVASSLDFVGDFNVPVDTDGGDDAEDLARKIEEARLEYLLALVEEDPLQAAQIARQKADVALKYAKGEAEELEAKAEQIRADRQIATAIHDISASEVDLLIAHAEAADEVVEASRLRLQNLNELLQFRYAQGAGAAELNGLKGEIAAETANYHNEVLAEEKEQKQFLLDIGQITKGQYAAFLESVIANKEVYDLSQSELRDLQRELYNLKNDLGSDFQFNLPSELAPALYEARRLGQSTNFGTTGLASYQDNRVVTVRVEVATNASPADIADAVAAAVGDPLTTGTTLRIGG